MSDPQTINKLLAIPVRGSDVDTWDVPVNGDFVAIDGMLGGMVAVALTNVNVSLTQPTGSTAPGAGPTQAQNAIIQFTGALSGNVVVTLGLPGIYVVHNACSGAFTVTLRPTGGGELIGLPPNELIDVVHDGTNIRFRNLERVGAYVDMAAAAVPTWITACTAPPYLNCIGGSYSSGTYPALFALMGTTTIPDLRGRFRAALNQGTGRIATTGNSLNPDGNTLFATGGVDSTAISRAQLPNINFTVSGVTLNDPGHIHVATGAAASAYAGGANGAISNIGTTAVSNSTSGVTISAQGVAASGGSGSTIPNIPPAQICGITLIRAA